MKFDEATNKKEYYSTVTEALPKRPILEKYKDKILLIQSEMFNLFNLHNNISIDKSFFDKDKYIVEQIPLIVELDTFNEFEQIVEGNLLDYYLKDEGLKIYIIIGEQVFVKNDYWEEISLQLEGIQLNENYTYKQYKEAFNSSS